MNWFDISVFIYTNNWAMYHNKKPIRNLIGFFVMLCFGY